jgi:hypothetical protein
MRVTKLVQKATRLSDARACLCVLTIRFERQLLLAQRKGAFASAGPTPRCLPVGTALYGDMVVSLEVAGGSEVGVEGGVCVDDMIYLSSNCGC